MIARSPDRYTGYFIDHRENPSIVPVQLQPLRARAPTLPPQLELGG
jgi:hypothetical protein